MRQFAPLTAPPVCARVLASSRVLSSDLGKIFFKSLGGNKFKAKASKAVKASKENWCRAAAEPEFCLV